MSPAPGDVVDEAGLAGDDGGRVVGDVACSARMLISMPEMRPSTAAGQGVGEGGPEGQPGAGLAERRQGRKRNVAVRRGRGRDGIVVDCWVWMREAFFGLTSVLYESQ